MLLVSLPITAFAAYRALSSRRALVSGVYRSRALWTGMGAIIILAFESLQIIGENSLGPGYFTLLEVDITYFVLTIVGIIVIFSWIDSTILVALDMDYFHRDSLHWRGFRKYLWVTVLAAAIAQAFASTQAGEIAIVVLLGVPVVYSAVALGVGSGRVFDETMRRYVKWMVFLVAALALELLTTAINFDLNFPIVVFAYFLYRAAGSLLKTDRLVADVGPGRMAAPSRATTQE